MQVLPSLVRNRHLPSQIGTYYVAYFTPYNNSAQLHQRLRLTPFEFPPQPLSQERYLTAAVYSTPAHVILIYNKYHIVIHKNNNTRHTPIVRYLQNNVHSSKL